MILMRTHFTHELSFREGASSLSIVLLAAVAATVAHTFAQAHRLQLM